MDHAPKTYRLRRGNRGIMFDVISDNGLPEDGGVT